MKCRPAHVDIIALLLKTFMAILHSPTTVEGR
jgi:hypothetical protein